MQTNPIRCQLMQSHRALMPAWLGFCISAIIVSAGYIGVLALKLGIPAGNIYANLGIAEGIYVVGGFLFALLILPIPWVLVSLMNKSVSFNGYLHLIYYAINGVFWFLVLNCITVNPIFDFDQTPAEIMYSAFKLQGLHFGLCGGVFGALYFSFSVRHLQPQSGQDGLLRKGSQ